MSTFTERLAKAVYGLAVPFANGYVAYVSRDDERGGFHIAFCKESEYMPPHKTAYAASVDEVKARLIEIGARFDEASEIEEEDA